MKKLSPIYSTNRMVAEYAERFYIPAAARHLSLARDKKRVHSLMDWRRRVHAHAPEVCITEVASDGGKTEFQVGSKVMVRAQVFLGALAPADVRVQAYYGALDAEGQVSNGAHVELARRESDGSRHLYEGEVECAHSGSCGLSVRVVPFHEDALVPYELPWVKWAD